MTNKEYFDKMKQDPIIKEMLQSDPSDDNKYETVIAYDIDPKRGDRRIANLFGYFEKLDPNSPSMFLKSGSLNYIKKMLN